MSSISTPTIDPEINRTLSYWFDVEEPAQKWFLGGPTVDAEIRDQFTPLIEKARAEQLMSWSEEPKGSLALLLLLDQFPRNIFRGSALSYSSDPMALDIATKSIAKGFHKEAMLMQEAFFILPLMHSESLVSQIASCALYESLLSRRKPGPKEESFVKLGIRAAKSHRNIIMKFGRFPGRNNALGRESTPEEIQFLKDNPSGL
jgi:uncharacterized protein (DUF924 family)